MDQIDHSDVLVIGAGIAGLTTAYYLQQQGFSVVVLEASERPGGRVYTHSCEHGGFEIGAQFFHQDYLDTLQLVKDTKLFSKTYVIPFTVGIYERIRVNPYATKPLPNVLYDACKNRIFRMDHLYWPLQRHLMPVQARKQCLSFLSKNFLHPLRIFTDPYDVHSNSQYLDQVTIRQWMEQQGFGDFYRHMLAPTIRALFFGDPDEMSALHALSHFGNRLRPWKLWSIEGGASTIVEAIAKQLIIFYNHKVQGICMNASKFGKHSIASSKYPNEIIVKGEYEGTRFQFRTNFVVCANYGEDTWNWLYKLGAPALNKPSIYYYGTQVNSFRIQNHPRRFTLPFSGIFRDFDGQEQLQQPISAFVSQPNGRMTFFSKHEAQTEPMHAYASQNGWDLSEVQDATTYIWRRAIPAFPPGTIHSVQNWLRQVAEWRRQNSCFVHICGDWTQLGCVEGAVRSGKRVVDEIIGLRKHFILEKN